MIYYDTIKRQLTQQELDGNFEQLKLRAQKLSEAQDMPIILRKDLTRPLTPREMDSNFQSLDLSIKRALYGDGPYPSADFIFDGATVLPAGLTFSRSTPAWYWKNGILVEAGIDEPVFEDGALRLEPQSTNFLKESGIPSDSTVWGHHSVLLEDIDVSPYLDTEVIISAQHAVAGFSQSNVVDNTDARAFTFSCFGEVLPDAVGLSGIHIGRDHGGNQERWYLKIDRESGEIESATVRDEFGSLVDYGSVHISGNVRFYWITVKPLAGASGQLRHRFSATNTPIGSRVFRIGRQQLEKASTPTSYIPTHGSPATRTADNLSLTGAAFQRVFNPNEGALVLTAKMLRTALGGVGANIYLFNFLTPTGVTPYLGFGIENNTSSLTMRSNSFSSGSHTTVIPEVQVGRTYKIALAWNSENEVVAFVDGERVTSKFMQQGFMQSLTDLFIGGGRGSQYTIGSRIEAVSLYKTRPTDAQMEALTNV